ncbi:LPS-assembly protein LptD [Actomonas aquatica]|uniref:LPS assembly protein LptD n=1 Tax=Actomonas aquatica TaxID=2866162 RepID=A0ABZ1C9L8_9BACT|nr:LPS assembly protein LptD [Opitutus sp. WL0086]WRQ87923.1 LPS assembly protein LptD [Opitutus sp. WL0086]
MLISLAVGLAPLRAQTPAAATQPPSIRADELDASYAEGIVIYRGNVVANFDDIRLTADEMRWNRATNEVTATGRVVAQQAGRRILAQEITYDRDTRHYTVTDLRFGRSPIYVSGEAVEGAPDRLTFRNATVSFGEPHPWSPTVTADALTYYPERDLIEADGGRVGLGFFRPLPLPGTPLPTDVPFVSDLTFDGGYTSRLGPHLLVGAKVASTDWLQLGAELGIYTKRGVMAGPSARYDTTDADTGLGATGRISTGYIHDTGDRLTDLLGDPIDPDRGIISWSHRQQFSPRLTFNAELNYWSDSEVVRDFLPQGFFPVQVPDSFAELTYTTANTVSGLFFRAQPNDYHRVRERLPEVTFDVLPTPVAAGWVHEAHAAVALLRDDPPTGSPVLRSDRFDFYYALTRPWTPESWLSIAPVVGARVTHYDRALAGRSDYTRSLGEFGVDAQFTANAVFDYQNERWGINGLRHLVTPKLSYRYVPEADKGTAYIPAIDRRVFATYLDPLGLGARRQIDQLGSLHTLRLALDQRLQTRDEIYGSRDLVRLNVAIDSRFDTAPSERTLSALHTELKLTPAPFIDFELYHRATPGDWTMRELNTAITLRSADRWSVQFANHYLEGDIQEFIAGLAYRLNEVWEGYTRHHYDSRRDRFVEQTYGIRQTIANRWIVGYELSFYSGQRRESDFGFNVVLDAINF